MTGLANYGVQRTVNMPSLGSSRSSGRLRVARC
jgi:hypothetical protein